MKLEFGNLEHIRMKRELDARAEILEGLENKRFPDDVRVEVLEDCVRIWWNNVPIANPHVDHSATEALRALKTDMAEIAFWAQA